MQRIDKQCWVHCAAPVSFNFRLCCFQILVSVIPEIISSLSAQLLSAEIQHASLSLVPSSKIERMACFYSSTANTSTWGPLLTLLFALELIHVIVIELSLHIWLAWCVMGPRTWTCSVKLVCPLLLSTSKKNNNNN